MDKDKKLLTRILDNISRSMNQNYGNIERFNNSREFIFKSTLSAKTKNSLSVTNAPIIEFNISEAFLSRLRGEFSQNEPGISVTITETANNNPQLEQTREIIEGHIRYILDEANKNGVQTSIFDEVISGGYSVAKVYPTYEEGKTFKQKIVFSKCYNSTLTGFDVLSREPSRCDSDYSFELFSYPKEKFEEEFDIKLQDVDFSKQQEKFSWFYKVGDQEVVVVADYYEKKIEKVNIVFTSDGNTLDKNEYETLVEQIKLTSFIAPPVIVDERQMDRVKIIRYKVCGNTLLDKEEYKQSELMPLVFFDGNSVVLSDGGSKNEVMCRPYLINCLGAQKLYNNLGIALADECQSLSRHKLLIAEEAISPNYTDHITKPQQYDTLVYRAFYNNDPNKLTPTPIQMQRNAFPPEILALFNQVPNIFQNILGSYDAELGINGTKDISGVAILQGAIHSSATAKPYINKYILSLNQVAKIILDLIPKIYKNEMSLPIINKENKTQYVKVNAQGTPNMEFEPNTFNINVKAGIGSSAAKTQALTQIVQLAQAMPIFAEFINTKGLSILVSNLELEGQDLLKLMADEFQQELEERKKAASEQQGMNPLVLREQNKQLEIKAKIHKDDLESSLDAGELELKRQELLLKEKELAGKVETEKDYLELEREKLAAEKAKLVVDIAHDKLKMEHSHKMDHTNMHHKYFSLHHKVTGNPHLTK